VEEEEEETCFHCATENLYEKQTNIKLRRMAFSGMLRCVAVVRTEVSEEPSIIRVTRIGELVTANVIYSSPILVTLMIEALSSYETFFLTRATRRNIPEDNMLHSHR
jgi:hypothetical protein